MRNVIIIILLLVTVASVYWFWLRPPIVTISYYDQELKRDEPKPPPPPVEQPVYAKFKEELKDWLDIGGKAIPVISFGGALWLKRKKKGK